MIRAKKSYSPARRFQYEEVLKNHSVFSIKRLKSAQNKPQPSESFLKKSEFSWKKLIRAFQPKSLPKVHLVEPGEISFIMKRRKDFGCKDLGQVSVKNIEKTISELCEKRKEIEKVPEVLSQSKLSKLYFKMIKLNRVSDLTALVKENPDLVNEVDSLGMTGLHWAAIRSLLNIAKLLVSLNCPIFKRDVLGRSVSDIAKKQKNPDFLHFISERIMQLEIRNSLIHNH